MNARSKNGSYLPAGYLQDALPGLAPGVPLPPEAREFCGGVAFQGDEPSPAAANGGYAAPQAEVQPATPGDSSSDQPVAGAADETPWWASYD